MLHNFKGRKRKLPSPPGSGVDIPFTEKYGANLRSWRGLISAAAMKRVRLTQSKPCLATSIV
jgi:hypothetical protein